MSRPWMPLYVADYLGDTTRLSTLEHGAYMLLIMEYWQHGSLPADDNALARIARMTPREWSRIKVTISHFFDGEWRHKRIDAELGKADAVSSKRRASAEKRWGGDRSKPDAKAPANARPNAYPSADASEHANAGANDMHRAPVPQPQPQPQDKLVSSPPVQRSPARSPEIELRTEIARAFEAIGSLPPDTSRAAVWIAQGRDATICAAVVRDVLARNPRVNGLKYFDRAIEEAHEKRRAAPVHETVVIDPSDPLVEFPGGRKFQTSVVRDHMRWHLEDPRQNRWDETRFGNPPNEPGCAVTTDLLAEFGLSRIPYPEEVR